MKKIIAKVLINRGSISKIGTNKFRLRDNDINPILNISKKYFNWLKTNVLIENDQLFKLDLNKVKLLNNKYELKKEYNKLFKNDNTQNR